MVVYVRNDPVNLIDPDGRFAQVPRVFSPLFNPTMITIIVGMEEYSDDGSDYDIESGQYQKPDPACKNKEAVAFVHEHQADAAAIAKQLNTKTEFVLGLSARETGYGQGRFATEGNNFFSLQTRVANEGDTPTTLLPFSTGWLQAQDDPLVFVAKYESYLDSAKSFASIHGDVVKGIEDAGQFLGALKNAGFNNNPDFTNTNVIDMVKRRMECP